MMTTGMWNALRRFPASDQEPLGRPKWTHTTTIGRLLVLGLIEEVSIGRYRRTATGEALLARTEPPCDAGTQQ